MMVYSVGDEHPFDDGEFFQRLQRGGQVLQALAGELETARRYEGTDATGTIRVVLADDRLPELIDLPDDWQRGVGAEGFGAAVTEACRAAMLNLGTDMEERAERTGWMSRVLAVMQYVNGTGPEPPEVSALPPDPATTGDGSASPGVRANAGVPANPPEPRPLDQIAADLREATDSIPDLAAMLAPGYGSHTGTAAHGRLTLTAGPGDMVTCDADAEWVSRREPEELREALATALAGLRESWSAANAVQAAARDRAARLATELTSYR